MYFRNRMYLSQDEIRDKIQTKTKQMLERKTFKKKRFLETRSKTVKETARQGMDTDKVFVVLLPRFCSLSLSPSF